MRTGRKAGALKSPLVRTHVRALRAPTNHTAIKFGHACTDLSRYKIILPLIFGVFLNVGRAAEARLHGVK